ncbi:MAG: hypothetical protein HY562_05220 [Ignavibacteriales bacterium]|nr:hypothetical protein [Ignavibacteriales bacterium]
MESYKLYKALFFAGSGWNFAIAGSLFVLTPWLHTIIGVEPPRYPIFIQFNLMSIFFFGCLQWMVARDPLNLRSVARLLMWAKFTMVGIFVFSLLTQASPKALAVFLLPGIAIDGGFGLIFWRFLVFSRSKPSYTMA